MMDVNSPRVSALLRFDGTLADAALRTSWSNPDGCGYAAGRFGQALAKTASQRGIYTPASDAFDFGTGDFTLECWLYAEGMSRDFGAIIGSGTVYWGAPSTFLMLTGNAQPSATKNRLHFGGNLLGTPLLMSGLLNAGQWYHVAISRAAGVCRMFVDGVVQATASYTGAISFANNGTWIGSNGWDGTNSYLDGRIDELRVTKGLARYTADFSPPTAALDYQPPGLQVLDGLQQRSVLGRRGVIAGTTYVNNSIAPNRKVRLYDRRLGTLVAETWSDAAGHYQFGQLVEGREYVAMALDGPVVQYNAVVQDRVIP